jgi:flagellar motor switch protein FliG
MVDETLNWRFTFEDILRIDNNGVQNEVLLVSLKTAMDELKEIMFSNGSERVAVMLKEDSESLGPMKTSEVEKAQQNIIYMCKQLAENGKKLIGGGEALV